MTDRPWHTCRQVCRRGGVHGEDEYEDAKAALMASMDLCDEVDGDDGWF